MVKSQSDGWIQGKGANQTGGYKEKEPIGNQTGGYKENEPIRRVDTKKRSQSDGWIQRKGANQTGGYKEKEPIRRRGMDTW